MKKIPIFFTFDNNYVIPAAVAFYSLLKKANKDIFFEMYVLHSNINHDNKAILYNIVSQCKNGKLEFIYVENFLDDAWDSKQFCQSFAGSTFTVDTIIRCFVSRFLQDIDKIIYSDVDVVFMDDISELYDINLKNKYIAGVRSPFIKHFKSELSHLSEENYHELKDSYIGGGIWVMNLKKIREDKLEDEMLRITLDDSIEKKWNDQDIINLSCKNKVVFLPLNYISLPHIITLMKQCNYDSHYTKEEIFDSVLNPKILHYAGDKPWNSNPKFSDIWHEIFNYLELPKTSIFKQEDKPGLLQRAMRKLRSIIN